MASRRRVRSGSRRGSRPRYRWVHDASNKLSLGIGAQAVFDVLGNLTTAEKVGIVIVRLLLNWALRPNAISQTDFLDQGVCMVSDDAFNGLVVPDPSQAEGGAWYFWKSQAFEGSSETEARQYEADMRTARKLPSQDHTMVWVVDNNAFSEGSFEISLATRALIRLP